MTDGQVMRRSLARLGIRLECEQCKAVAVELGRCNVCRRGYVHRVLLSDRPRPRVLVSANLAETPSS